jgi:rare lipoprotein A
VAGANLGLPVPSRVQVTNVATGAVITVRIDDKAPIGDAIVRLSPDAAKGLGADPGKPLLVRMRYLAPVIAYNERPTLRYALGGGPRRAPATAQPPAATAFAAQAKPAPVPPAPLVAAPAPPARVLAAAAPPRPQPAVIRMAEVHPAAPALRPMIAAPAPKAAEARAAAGAFRVQAGAFANLDNAHRAVSRLEPAGGATIEPIKRGALVLYRVIVPGPKDPRSAERLRARVAQIGFSDARVLQPL